jgi:hypothetical protein
LTVEYTLLLVIHTQQDANINTVRIKRHYSQFFYWWGGTKSLGTAATSGLLYIPQMIDEDDCGATGGMKIGRGNRSTLRKNLPQRHFVYHKSHMTRPGLEPRAAAVESQRLTA